MKRNMFRKGIVLGIILLFVGAGVIPSTVGTIERNTNYAKSHSGGYIQDLIDNASNGDTIYIPSGIYYENIIINKSISLIGEDKNTTIIDGGGSGDVVYVTYDWVNISGFTIQNSGTSQYLDDAGIDIRSQYNIITGNNISNNRDGIYLYYCDSNTITRNTISNKNRDGITLINSHRNTIIGNNISNNRHGIYLYYCDSNNITGNNISNNDYGIRLICSHENTIIDNSFFNNGLIVFDSHSNNVENNLVNGKPLVYLVYASDYIVTDAGQVILQNCNNISVENLNLSNASIGLILKNSDNCLISDNIISSNNVDGIRLDGESNIISGNNISNNGNGIYLGASKFNVIKGNTISNKGIGINLGASKFNIIRGNTISNNMRGIFLWESKFNIIKGNTISKNKDGIILTRRSGILIQLAGIDINLISKNNFIDNEQDSYFTNSFFNKWILNYWNKPRILPKLIHGKLKQMGGMMTPGPEHSKFNFDWRPALKPYDIEVLG